MKKRIAPLLLSLFLLSACGQKPPETDILDYWREIYGEENVIQQDGAWVYARPRADYNREAGKYELLSEPLTIPLDPAWEAEPYTGDLFSLSADTSAWKAEGTVIITLRCQAVCVFGADYFLQYRNGDAWHTLNGAFSFPLAEYRFGPGERVFCTLTEDTLGRIRRLAFDEDKGFVVTEESRPVPLHPGRYRLLTAVSTEPAGEGGLLCVEFTLG